MKTQIIYEDQHILVCYKPAGIAVQTASVGQQDMVSELKNYLAQGEVTSKAKNKNAGGSKEPYIGVVHRLDQPVSGVLVFAKNPSAAASLSAQIQDGRAGKIYRAQVYGVFENAAKEGVLEDILYKDARTNTSRVVNEGSREAKQGKKAKLSYKVMEEITMEDMVYSEVEIKLYTGRHHQIRVQMAAVGHPILGDTKYGVVQKSSSLKLCAYELTFIHPNTKKEMTFTVSRLPWSQENMENM